MVGNFIIYICLDVIGIDLAKICCMQVNEVVKFGNYLVNDVVSIYLVDVVVFLAWYNMVEVGVIDEVLFFV